MSQHAEESSQRGGKDWVHTVQAPDVILFCYLQLNKENMNLHF